MRFWKKRLQCTVALVCMLAMITSLLPTAAFAQEVIPTDSTVQADPNGPATEPTTTPADAEPTPETVTPTPESTAEPTPETATPTPEATAEPTPEAATPTPAQQPVMKAPAAPANANGNDAASNGARAPKVPGDATATSEDEIFTVDYYNGPGSKTNLTVIMQDEAGNEIDRTAAFEAYESGSTMVITLNEAYLQDYELKNVSSEDATISSWSGDFKDAGKTTFTWSATGKDTATIYVIVAEQDHLLELESDDGTVNLGSILWKEGGNQLTKVEAYLNYELVYTSDYMRISNSLHNFDLTVNEGYYFDTEM